MGSLALVQNRVLVLNKFYQPVNVISIKSALKKVIKGIAEIVTVEDESYYNYDFTSWTEFSQLKSELNIDNEYDEFILGSFLVPRVIRSLTYSGVPKKHVKLNRRNIYQRDGNICQYCGNSFPTDKLSIDHIIPRSQGGKTTWNNVACACKKCNSKKGGKTPKEAHMHLIRKPFEPKANQKFFVTIDDKKYMSWSHFVSEVYWTIDLEE